MGSKAPCPALFRDHDLFRSIWTLTRDTTVLMTICRLTCSIDYVTVPSYYFGRLSLLLRFGVEARLPFYEAALDEFGPRIPARLNCASEAHKVSVFRGDGRSTARHHQSSQG